MPDRRSAELARRNWGHALFRAALAALILAGVFGAGFYSAQSKNVVYRAAVQARQQFTEVRRQLRQTALRQPVQFLQPARYPGDGVTLNLAPDQEELILLSGFMDGGNTLRLIRRDGEVVANWPVALSEILDKAELERPPATDWNVDLHGALALPDGSLVFNFEYTGLVHLSRCGEVIWSLAERTHHSVVRAENGGYWVPSRRTRPIGQDDAFPPFSRGAYPAEEDLILRVSDEGRIVEQVSVPGILYRNDLSALLTANGRLIDAEFRLDDGGELVHLNKIAELTTAMAPAFDRFSAGDLLLSLRTSNLLLVVDPSDRWRVKWYQTGPWQRQHDPDFRADGKITLFNNDAFVAQLDKEGRIIPSDPARSDIMAHDPDDGTTEVIYGDFPGQAFGTVVRGAQEPRPGGGSLIVEAEAGRIFETDGAGKLIWEYVNRFDDDNIAEMTGASVYAPDYFKVADWTCP